MREDWHFPPEIEEPPYCDRCGQYGHDSLEWQKCSLYDDPYDDGEDEDAPQPEPEGA